MDRKINVGKNSITRSKVIIPSEPELELNRRVNGIPLVDAVVKDLNELAEKLGVEGLG